MIFRLLLVTLTASCIVFLGHFLIITNLFSPVFIFVERHFEAIFLTLCFLLLFGFIIIRTLPYAIRIYFELIMFFWMGLAYHYLFVLLLFSPIQIIGHLLGYDVNFFPYLCLILGTLLALFSIRNAVKKEKVTEVSIPVAKKKLGRALEDLRVVQISDVHVSGLIKKRRVERIVSAINKLKPHIVIVTGDLIDGKVKQLKKSLEHFKSLESSLGVFYVTGNHEYYYGGKAWKKFLSEDLSWHVLENTTEAIKFNDLKINIVGIEDKMSLANISLHKRQDKRFEEALKTMKNKESSLNIVLAHRPKDASFMASEPWLDCQFSGHTHGGQLFPVNYLVKKDQKYVKGLYQLEHKQYLYVNQGTGFWGPPMRLGTECEITLITFKQL